MIENFNNSNQIFFAERLSLLLQSGISIADSINIIMKIDSGTKRTKFYNLIITDINKGIPLSKSIQINNIKFNTLLIQLIQNGEASGTLHNSLKQASEFLKKKSELKEKIISSLIYPAFIVFFTLIMTLFLILFIFPKILPLLNSLKIQLPLITRFIQSLYLISIKYGIYIIIIMLLMIFLTHFIFKKNKKIRIKTYKTLINLPIVGNYFKMYFTINLCHTGEIFLNSGNSVIDLIKINYEYNKNDLYAESYLEVNKQLSKGISLWNALSIQNNIFPQLLIHMCGIGEKTGNLPNMFSNCAKVFDYEIDNILKKFTSLIEPTLMVTMGLIVGGVALSIILPIYEITNNLSK